MRVRLNQKQQEELGLKPRGQDVDGRYPRYTLKGDKLDRCKELFPHLFAKPNKVGRPTKKNNKGLLTMAAFDDNNKCMDIDEFCEFHNLPRVLVQSYNLVTHTGLPFYNVKFKEVKEDFKFIDEVAIENVIKKHISPVTITSKPKSKSRTFDRLVFTDTHVGMEPNQNGFALYGTTWNEDDIMETAQRIVQEVCLSKTSDVLYVDDLGDFLDGWDGYTTRGGHALPQNMDNEKAYDVGVAFKMYLLDNLVDVYDDIVFNNVCNDNHSGSFAYVVNKTFKSIAELKYPESVKVNNLRRFIDHYYVGEHAFILTHGKDGKALKFGFKPALDTKQIEKIDQYLKINDIYKNAKFVEFSKGDSHQCVFDMAGSDDFDYMNYPAISPSSEWVQTNFKRGRRGFTIQNIEYNSRNKRNKVVWL